MPGQRQFPPVWQVDLRRTQAVDNVTLTFEDPTFKYQGRAEASEDGKTGSAWPNSTPPVAARVAARNTRRHFRFLRVTFYGGENSAGEKKWPSCAMPR